MRRDRYFWAALLIFGGALLLANNLGYLAVDLWNLFWPLVLILAGVWFLWGSIRGAEPWEAEQRSIDLQGAEQAEIRIKHGAGRLRIDGSAVPGKLLSGTFRGGLSSRVQEVGSGLQVELKPDSATLPGMFLPWNWISGEGLSWELGLSPETDLSLTLETGAGEAYLNLHDLQVSGLVLKTGASATDIVLPSGAGYTRARIEAGAAAVNIQIPEGVGARIRAQGGLASVDVNKARFPRQNDHYLSPDYETAEHQVDLEIQTGLGAIEIH